MMTLLEPKPVRLPPVRSVATPELSFIDRRQYDRLTRNIGNYDWDDVRWAYTSKVIWLLRQRHIPRSEGLLEIGCASVPICLDSCRLDLVDYKVGAVIQDAGRTPWPFDRKFGAVVALQVYEHIRPEAKRAFSREAGRRANRLVVFSLPWKWKMGTPDHRDIDHEVMYRWTGCRPLDERLVGCRMILMYDPRKLEAADD